MAMGTGGSSKGVKSDINVTPLVDVCLVLLIIFMVVTPMLQRGKDVKLPASHRVDEENKEGDPVILSVTKDKRMFVESDQYDDQGLSERIAMELRAAPGRKLLLKGDQTLTYGDVRRVLELARLSGARTISLGVEEMKKK